MTKSLVVVAILSCSLFAARAAESQEREVKTLCYSLALKPDSTSIESLSVDSLGKGEFRPSVLFPPDAKPSSQTCGYCLCLEFSEMNCGGKKEKGTAGTGGAKCSS